MRISQAGACLSLPCFLSLALSGALAAPPNPPAPKGGPTVVSKTLEIKGEAKISIHPYKMEKGNTYRLTVQAEGFVPRLRIRGYDRAPFNPLGGTPLFYPAFGLPAGAGADTGRGRTRMTFLAPATKEYQIIVEALGGDDLPAGPLPYTLRIERAVFRPCLTVADRPLEVTENTNKLTQGKVYAITVTGKGFAPEVQVLDGSRRVATAFNGRWFGFGPDAEFVTTLTFTPTRTTDYRIVLGVGPVEEQRRTPLRYTTAVAELKVALSLDGQLTKQDPAYPRGGGPHKVHVAKLEGGKTYQINLRSATFDPYLYLEDQDGKVVAEDDNSGGAMSAFLVFRPSKTATYRIVATTYNRAGPRSVLGPYTLRVLENPEAQPRFGTAPAFGGGFPDFPNE